MQTPSVEIGDPIASIGQPFAARP